jgi:hypothetical protein
VSVRVLSNENLLKKILLQIFLSGGGVLRCCGVDKPQIKISWVFLG